MRSILGTVAGMIWTAGLVVLPGCSGSQPAGQFTERATSGYTTAIHDDLVSLPPPQDKIVVAVYKFRDQTGQYKTSAQATTFSTAVTQGATSLVVKALEDSGWFTVIEREALPNLLNERQIIRSTRAQYAAEGGGQLPPVPPLLYAGVLLEGGIIGYDTNVITGGMGAAYMGIFGSGQMRSDQITIYLRLVSTQNGQVLKSISTSKSILSKEVNIGVYRFVRTNALLELETGLSTNEPPTMCTLEAIEKAIYDMIVDGVLDGLWALRNPEDMNAPAIQERLKERQDARQVATSARKQPKAGDTPRAPEPLIPTERDNPTASPQEATEPRVLPTEGPDNQGA